MTRKKLKTFGPLATLLWRVDTAIVLGLVLVGAFVFDDWIKRIPFFTELELIAHAKLSRLDPRTPRVERVSIVEIDDRAFWSEHLAGVEPTDRRFLGEVVRAAAKAGAAVIALDLQLKSPFSMPGDEQRRMADNKYLLTAIREIANKGTPVVLTIGLVRNGNSDDWKEEPNIFEDSELPEGVALGYINLPKDRREVPLEQEASAWDGRSKDDFDSFALQTVNAYELVGGILPTTKQRRPVDQVLRQGGFVYGGFLAPSAFPRGSARDLVAGNSEATRICRHRIVLVGGTWHKFGEGRGPLVESFQSPAGDMPGVYFHANYIESLLDGRVKREVPRWFAAFVDLLLALAMYLSFALIEGTRKKLAIGSVFLVICMAAYIFPVNFGWYLDFVILLSLCFVHLIVEHYRALRQAVPKRRG